MYEPVTSIPKPISELMFPQCFLCLHICLFHSAKCTAKFASIFSDCHRITCKWKHNLGRETSNIGKLSYTIYQFLLHPLRRFPGPLWAKVSPIPLVLQCRKARRSEWVLEQHEKYGPVVRIAPNHISINKPEAVNQIYGHKTGFCKGPFYDDKSI